MSLARLASAAEDLSALLEAENAALAAMNIPSVTALVPTKQDAVAALLAAQLSAPASIARAQDTHRLRSAIERLKDLGAANKTLLERALLAQDRVLGCIARAMPRAMAQDGRYGAAGANLAPPKLPPVALSARA